MALARSSLLAAMAGELREPIDLADILPIDTTGNLKEPLDRTFRALGVAETDLPTASVATGSEAKAIAFATYFVYARVTSALADQVNMSSVGSRADLHQLYENMKDRMADALVIAQGFGLSIAGSGASGVVPLAYAGGIDVADFDDIAEDDSIMPRLFSMRDLGMRIGSSQSAVGE